MKKEIRIGIALGVAFGANSAFWVSEIIKLSISFPLVISVITFSFFNWNFYQG